MSTPPELIRRKQMSRWIFRGTHRIDAQIDKLNELIEAPRTPERLRRELLADEQEAADFGPETGERKFAEADRYREAARLLAEGSSGGNTGEQRMLALQGAKAALRAIRKSIGLRKSATLRERTRRRPPPPDGDLA